MKKLHIIVLSLIMGIGLTSCHHDSSEDDSAVQEAAIQVDVAVPTIRMPKEERPFHAPGPAMALQQIYPKSIVADIKYGVGQTLNVNFMVGIQTPQGDKAVLYINRNATIMQDKAGNCYMTINRTGNIPLQSPTTAKQGESVIRYTPNFFEHYTNNVAQSKVYIGVIAGGIFAANNASHPEYQTSNYFKPTQGVGPETIWGGSSYYTTTQTSDGWYKTPKRILMLTPGYNVAMQIPLTTNKWIEITDKDKRVVYTNKSWAMHFEGIEFQLNPAGELIGFVYDRPKETWINHIALTRTQGDLAFPLDTNIYFDTDFTSTDPLRFGDSYSYFTDTSKNIEAKFPIVCNGWDINYQDLNNGVHSASNYDDLYHRLSPPLFFWAHGNSGVYQITVGFTDICRSCGWSGSVSGASWEGIYRYPSLNDLHKGTNATYAGQYYTDNATTTSTKTMDVSPQKSYIVSINTDLANILKGKK